MGRYNAVSSEYINIDAIDIDSAGDESGDMDQLVISNELKRVRHRWRFRDYGYFICELSYWGYF